MNIPGFTARTATLDGIEIGCSTGGNGPPLLLVHGFSPARDSRSPAPRWYLSVRRGRWRKHFFPDTAPEATAAALAGFLGPN